ATGAETAGAPAPAVLFAVSSAHLLFIRRPENGRPRANSHAGDDMRILSRLRLRTKLLMLAALSVLATAVVIGVGASVLYTLMVNDRIDKRRAVVQSAIGIAQSLEERVAAAALTREQAFAQLKGAIHAMRFDHGTGYIVVMAPDGVTLIFGADPKRDGQPSPG